MCSLSHDLIHDARYWWIMLQLPHALGKAGTYFNVMQHRGSNFSLMHGNLFRKNVRQNGITCHPQRKHLLKPGLPRSRASGKKPACSLSWLLSQVLRHSTRLNIYTAILWRRCRDTELSKAMWVSEDVTTGSITMLAFARLTEQSIWIWLTLILQMSRLQRSGLHLPGQHLILKILSPWQHFHSPQHLSQRLWSLQASPEEGGQLHGSQLVQASWVWWLAIEGLWRGQWVMLAQSYRIISSYHITFTNMCSKGFFHRSLCHIWWSCCELADHQPLTLWDDVQIADLHAKDWPICSQNNLVKKVKLGK